MKIALVSMAALAAVSSGAAEVGPLVMDAEKPFAYAYDDAKAQAGYRAWLKAKYGDVRALIVR